MYNRIKYSPIMRLNHWVMAVVITIMIIIGLYLEYGSSSNPYRPTMFMLHKSFGVITIFLLLFRTTVRAMSPIPPYPAALSYLEAKSAKITHIAIYVLLFTMVTSGYVMSDSGGYGVQFFGYNIPHLMEVNKPLAKLCSLLHKVAAYTLISLLILHLAATVKHYFVDKINLLNRIV